MDSAGDELGLFSRAKVFARAGFDSQGFPATTPPFSQ